MGVVNYNGKWQTNAVKEPRIVAIIDSGVDIDHEDLDGLDK
jgi:hypothetical protein